MDTMFNDDSDTLCVNYLRKLLISEENIKFDFNHFTNLIQNEKISNEVILRDILINIFKLIEKCGKNFQLGSDLAYCFCLSVFSVAHSTSALFDIVQKKEISCLSLKHLDGIDSFIRENYSVLVLGMLRFFLAQKYEFQYDQFEILHSKLIDLVASELLDPNKVNTLLCIAEAWILLISRAEVPEQMLNKVYASVLSIITVYWNIDISEFHHRVEDLFLNFLLLNYEKDAKQKPHAVALNIIVNMSTIRTIAYDMSWSLPFKYYAYIIALKFIARIYHLRKFLRHIQDDLRIGFAASLQNKRVISEEIELFKFYTNSVPFDDWKKIFQPVIETVLFSTNLIVANNFSRYWLPAIIKNFPHYAVEIFDCIPKQTDRRGDVLSRILFALLKICHLRKVELAPVENDVDQLAAYLQTFFFDSEDTRGELFALLCNLRDQSTLHSERELETILIFLNNNARTTSTILRQHLFSSFARFVLRLICSNVKVIKNDPENADRKLSHVLRFLVDLNEFFASGIESGCCYQRKLISLTMYKIFMTYALRDCGGKIRKNNLSDVEKFVNFAKIHDSWKFDSHRNGSVLFRCLMDPCEEIQHLSFMLLRTFFDLTAINSNPSELLGEVLKLLNDRFFYKRNSGVSAVLSVFCLSYNVEEELRLTLLRNANYQVSNFTDMFLNLLETQVKILQKDILNSAMHHPLDATIKVLTFLMTHADSPEFDIISESQIEKLIALLEVVVPILLKALFIDKFSDYAPSFEESDNALEAIIKNSSIVDHLNVRKAEKDEFQLKPVNQILLNFIWITLKVSSELESYLISSRFDSLNEEQLIRCGDLVVQKLKLCRHKGVIEAAGISLSNIVKVLTENKACEKWLESIISDIIHLIEHKGSATVSRKSAGLSLLVQNIVGNDRRPNKPLLSLCWSEFRRILNVDFSQIDQTVLKELPQTHVLHFLKVLIADARNSEELSVFFEEITLVCLKTFKVPIWTIRNAALQLFGAIVPIMVGQKNSQNDFGVRHSFEEVFIRMPTLLDYIVSTFEMSVCASTHDGTRDSDLVPLLIVLQNIQVSSAHSMESNLHTKLLRLRESTKHLLGSDLHFVRELTSKSFVSLYCESEISVFKTIIDDVIEYIVSPGKTSNIRHENHLHGYLLVLQRAFSLHYASLHFQKIVIAQHSVLPFCPKLGKVSLKSATLLYELEIISCAKTDPLLILNYMTDVLNDLACRKHLLLGYDEWSHTLLQKMFKYRHECSFHQFASFCLNSSHSTIRNNFLKIFSASLDCDSNVVVFDLLKSSLNEHLHNFSNMDHFTLSGLFDAFIKLAESYKGSFDENYFSEIFNILIRVDHYEYQAASILVLCLMIPLGALDWQINSILKVVFQMLDPSKSNNKDVRLNLATSLLTLVNKQNSQINVHIFWLSLIEIVQDEEMEVRLIGCECYRSIRKLSRSSLNPELVLEELFDFEIMRTILSVDVIIQILWDTLITKSFDVDYDDEIANPFDQGVLNVYKEEIITVSTAGQTLIRVIHSCSFVSCWNGGLESAITHYYNTSVRKLIQTVEKILQNHLLVSTTSFTLVVRCYFLLLIFIELLKKSQFSLLSANFDDGNLQHVAEKLCRSLQETFVLFKT